MRQWPVYLRFFMLAVALVTALVCMACMDSFWNNAKSSQTEDMRKAILDACVQCYALEGSYPPDLEYLEKHYGLMLDRDDFYYYYEVFGSNVMPTVEVYRK